MSSPVSAPPANITAVRVSVWREAIWLILILMIAAGARFGNLLALPSFIDESGHIAWATDPDFTFAMLTPIGKVLGFLVFYPTARWSPDPLFATRALVALLGLVTIAGLYLAVRRLAGRPAAALAAAIWALLPYIVWHDRMALHDPLVSFFLIWAIVFFLAFLQRENRRGMLLLAGLFTGFAVATKITALVGVGWLVLLAAAYPGVRELRRKLRSALIFGAGALGPLGLFAAGGKHFLSHRGPFLRPLDHTPRGRLILIHARDMVDWITSYDSAAFTWFCGLVLVLAILYRSRVKTALLLSFLGSCAAYAIGLAVVFPRYLVPILLPMVMLAGIVTGECLSAAALAWRTRTQSRYLGAIGTAAVTIGLLGLCGVSWADAIRRIQTDPYHARLPAEDRFQYLGGWCSGTGVRELSAFLDRTARESGGKLSIFHTSAQGGHIRWSVPLYVSKETRAVYRYHPFTSRLDQWRVLVEAAQQPVYLVLAPVNGEARLELTRLIQPPLRPVFEFHTPTSPGGFLVYRLDRSMYLNPEPSPTLFVGDAPRIADIRSSSRLEQRDGQPFTWIERGCAMIHLDAPRAGALELEARLHPGPGVEGSGQSRLLIKTSTGFTSEIASGDGKMDIVVPVAAGRNEVVFGSMDQSNGPPLPDEVNRKVVIGLGGLRIAGFRTGAEAQPR